MTVLDIWTTLGIARTVDTTAIRRAYARRLKVTNPEDDPAGFEALRSAYDIALNQAQWAARASVSLDDDDEADEGSGGSVDLEGVELATLGQVLAAVERTGPQPEAAEPPAEPPPGNLRGGDPPDEFELAEEAHLALIGRLRELVSASAPDAEAIEAAFEAILNSPAMETVVVHDRTERWAADFILRHAPATDRLITRAIEFFRWAENRVGPHEAIGQPVMARVRDLEFLRYLKQPGTAVNRGFVALTRPAGGRRWRERLTPNLADEVRYVLDMVGREHPGLYREFDPHTLAWWQDHLQEPRVGAVGLLSLALAVAISIPALATLLLGDIVAAKALGVLAAAPAALAAFLVGRHYAVDVPKAKVADRWGWDKPLWLRFGWGAAGAVLLVLAAVVPASVAGGVAFALTGAVVAVWALVVTEPDRRPADGEPWEAWSYMSLLTLGFWLTQWLWRPGMAYSWQLRTLFAYAYLVIFWWLAAYNIPTSVWLQMVGPLAGVIVAWSMGAGSLADAWTYDADRRLKMGGAAAVVVLALAAGALIWAAGDNATLRTLGAVAATLAVLMHKPAGQDLSGKRFLLRDVAMRYGWIAWLIFASSMAFSEPAVLKTASLWVLTGPLIIAGFVVRDLLAPAPPKRDRPVWDR